MPAECTVCSSDLRALVESQALLGKTPTTIARNIDHQLSVSAVRRHMQSHYIMPSIEPAPLLSAVAEAAGSLWNLLVGSEAIRADAVKRGDSTTALRATRESTLILSAMAKDLRITDAKLADALAEFRALGEALWLEGRDDPDLLPRLIARVRSKHSNAIEGLEKFADQIKARNTKESPHV